MQHLRSLSVEIAGEPAFDEPGEAWLVLPRPYDDCSSRFTSLELDRVETVRETGAANSQQRAYLVKPRPGEIPQICYRFEQHAGELPKWFWQAQRNRFTEASQQLVVQARELTADCLTEAACVQALVDSTAGIFGYDHPDARFCDGHQNVPVLCDTAKGSCLDINTYLLASARCLGIEVQYIAGYWFHPERTETRDMHCWLAFRFDGEIVFWDLAHHLKWGVEKLRPGLNPAGGRRVPMSCGRGLCFASPNGEIEISHFSEPLWILPGGTMQKPRARIRIEES